VFQANFTVQLGEYIYIEVSSMDEPWCAFCYTRTYYRGGGCALNDTCTARHDHYVTYINSQWGHEAAQWLRN
jgi:hypothetical protein